MTTPTTSQPGDPVANRIRETANAKYDAARNNPRNSAVATRADVGAAYLAAKTEMDAASQSAADVAARTEQSDMRTAFGTPTDPASVMSYRDAQDRVAGIDQPEEAAALLARAIAVNDSMLAQALGLRSFDLSTGIMGVFDATSGWGAVLQQYADYRGDTVGAALGRLLKSRGATISANDLWTWVLPVPREVAGLQVYEIERLVAQNSATP